MKKFCYTVKEIGGLHARPIGKIVNEAQKYESDILIQISDEKFANAKKILEIMKLNIKSKSDITIFVSGPDENIAIQRLKKFFEENQI